MSDLPPEILFNIFTKVLKSDLLSNIGKCSNRIFAFLFVCNLSSIELKKHFLIKPFLIFLFGLFILFVCLSSTTPFLCQNSGFIGQFFWGKLVIKLTTFGLYSTCTRDLDHSAISSSQNFFKYLSLKSSSS